MTGGTARRVLAFEPNRTLPLTPCQRGVWFSAQQLAPAAYVVTERTDITGEIHAPTWVAAMNHVLAETPALRMRLVPGDNGVPRRRHDAAPATARIVDLRGRPAAHEHHTGLLPAGERGIDLGAGVVGDVCLVRTDDDTYALLQVHHIALDGHGFDLVTRRLVEVYEALLAGEEPPPRAADEARLEADLEAYPGSAAHRADQLAWVELAPDEHPVGITDAAPGQHRVSAPGPHADRVDLDVVDGRIEHLVSAVALTAAAHTGRRDVVVGVHVLGRTTAAALRTPAALQNILPVPVRVDPWESMSELVERVGATWRRARRHQRYRHEEIRRDRGVLTGGAPFADIFCNLTPFEARRRCGAAVLRPRPLWAGPLEGLTLTASADETHLESPAGAVGVDRLRQLADTCERAVTACARTPRPDGSSHPDEASVGAFVRSRRPATDRPRPHRGAPTAAAVTAGLRRTARHTPTRVVATDGRHRVDAASAVALIDHIGTALLDAGADAHHPVALHCERGVMAALAPLAAFDAGVPFVPVDPQWPPARRAEVIALAGARHTLHADDAGRVDLESQDGRNVTLTHLDAPARACPRARANPRLDDAAYVLFTSGSSGTPKGVVVERRHVAAYAAHVRTSMLPRALFGARLHRADTTHVRAVHAYPTTFDSALGPVVMLADGHHVHVADTDTAAVPARLAALVRDVQASFVDTSPAVLADMLDSGLALGEGTPLRTVCVGGDACSPALWERLRATPGLVAFNAYGPTECTVETLVADIGRHNHPVIGFPVLGADAVVLDPFGRECPAGTAGELYLLGDGVARGYLDDPARTASRFVAAPGGRRMYRTGDAARREPDGSIAFLGRLDDQMSLRGQRIEPAEVERALLALPGVRAAVASVRRGRHGDRLVGYVVAADPIDPAVAGDALRRLLPAAWVPSSVVTLDALPTTSRGKIDRDRLPDPGETAATGTPFAALTGTERLVAEVFADVLDIEVSHLGADTDLFDLGGHSLTAARVVGRLAELTGVDVSLRDVFARATPAALAAHLGDCNGPPPHPTIGALAPARSNAASAEADAGLGAAQQHLWFLERTLEASPLYVIPLVVTLTGELDVAALGAAVTDVVQRHPSLHTLVPAGGDGGPAPHRLTAADLRDRLTLAPLDVAPDDLDAAVRGAAARPIDITTDLPVRPHLYRVGAREHVLLLAVHHIAADGWSVRPLLDDLAVAYRARHAQQAPAFPALPALPGDPHGGRGAPGALDWWVTHLSGAPPEIDLPVDRPRPSRRRVTGGEYTRELSPPVVAALRRLAREHDATEFMVFAAAFAALLTRCGAGDDVVLGTVSSGRATRAQEQLVTFCAQTLALRLDTSADPTFAELLRRTREECLDALAHADVPFAAVVDAVNPPRATHRHPVFQVLLVLQNTGATTWRDVAGLDARVDVVGTSTAKFDLTLDVDLDAERPRLRWEFACDVFDASTIARMDAWFARLLEHAVSAPRTRVWEHPLDPSVHTPQARAIDPPTRTLTSWLEEAMKAHPDAVAVTDSGRCVTYAALDARSAALAGRLVEHQVGPGDVVALTLTRGVAQVVAVLAVLRAGAAYLPLDPAYPTDRLTHTVADAAPVLLVHDDETAGVAGDIARASTVVRMNLDDTAGVGPRSPANGCRHREVHVDDPAYVIFTSGSTGRPKGVRVSHGAVTRLLTATAAFGFGPGDTWTLFHSYAFDFWVWEMFGALCHGGRLVVVDADTARHPDAFRRLLAQEEVTVLNQTPSAFAQLVAADVRADDDERLPHLRFVVLGGEALDPAVLPAWFARHPASSPRVVNMYGITETTVHVTECTLDESVVTGPERSPVGTPLRDLRVHLLDAGLHPVPPGVVGEMYISGPGLADGYLGRPGLTATRFVAAPEGPPASRMYRSGDLAVRRPDGTLGFRGRSDRQVQLRGFRIELGEVEAAALTLDGVEQAHARVCRLGADDDRLVLDLVGLDATVTDPVEVRARLRLLLPAQMVPSAVVLLDALPLTVNGKLDVAALPTPQFLGRVSRPPSDPREQVLTEVFAELLALERVGVDDSFFDLGGHSLLAVRLLHRISAVWGVDLGIADLFEHPTPALLTELLTDASASGAEFDVLIALRANDRLTRPGVFCVHPAGGLSWCYAGLGRHLPPDVPLWGLQARGVTEPARQPRSLADMADDYIDAMLRVQPKGPFHLLGWSLGGMVVHVMAARLARAGHEVGVVALLDAYPSQAETGVEEPPVADTLSALLAMGGLDDDALAGRPVALASVAAALADADSALGGLAPERLEALATTYRNTARVLREYAHETFDGDVVFFRAARRGIGPDHDPAEWDRHVTGCISVHDIDATHREMTRPGALASIAAVLTSALFEAAPHTRGER